VSHLIEAMPLNLTPVIHEIDEGHAMSARISRSKRSQGARRASTVPRNDADVEKQRRQAPGSRKVTLDAHRPARFCARTIIVIL